MNYGLIYTIPFATLDNSNCVVEIEKKGYTGASTELTGGASPFVVDIADDEFAYTPLRFSTATINVVGGDYLQELFSTAYQQYRVTLKKNGNITWCGFVKPELYTQDYSSEIFTLELECISAMSTLEFIDYTQSEESGRKFVSLWDLIKKCIDSSSSQYNAVYFPQVYGKDASDVVGGNILKEMTVSEQNFFDEDNKPMKLKEVLEEVCKFLHWTCADWCGSLYFVDIDHKGNYSRYPSDLSQKSGEESILVKNVQDIGFAGSEHALDVLPGYNKVVVRCSNYPVGELLPEEKYDNLKELLTIDNVTEDKKEACRSIYLSPDRWNCRLFKGENTIDNNELDLFKDEAPSLDGAMLMKYCVYEQEKNDKGDWIPKITDYSFTNVIRLRYPLFRTSLEFRPGWYKILSFKGASATYADGAIGISGTVKVIKNNDMLPWGNSAAGYGKNLLGCQIRIGNKYYGNRFGDKMMGFDWTDDPDCFAQLSLDSWNNDGSLDWVTIPNDKTLDMPYTGLKGFIIPINRAISGEFEFSLLSYGKTASNSSGDMSGELIKDFSVKYQREDRGSKSNNNSDRIYENVINGSYINELDEIETKISSYNDDGACYSKVILNDGYLTDNLYSSIELDTIRPEELLIRRIIHRYSAPQIKLTQVIKATSDLTPISVLSDRFMTNKKFINVGGTIDFKMNRFNCIMIEK